MTRRTVAFNLKNMEHKDLFLSKEISNTLKGKGYNHPAMCYRWDETYTHSEGIVSNYDRLHQTPLHYQNWNTLPTRVSAPTRQEVVDWFRISHNIIIEPSYQKTLGVWHYYIIRPTLKDTLEYFLMPPSAFKDYYEAYDAAIIHAIELLPR
jgi:hypothetical protein